MVESGGGRTGYGSCSSYGTKNPVLVYRFFSEQSVEEKVLTLQQRKRKLFDDLFGGKSQKGGASFDRNDLLELLGEKK